MGKNYSKAKGRNAPPFVLLRHDMMDSPAWLSLSANAQALWLHIRRRFKGDNNGEMPLSCREAAALLNVSKNTASKAFIELHEKGFIAIGTGSAFRLKIRRSTRWIMTNEVFNGQPPTNEWRKWKPEET